jgi:cytochrome c oxidase subunit 2
VQSTFSTFGVEAAATRTQSISMFIAAAVLTVGVLALATHAVRAPAERLDHRGGMRVILWLGAVLPTVLLAILLLASLPHMRALEARDDGIVIAVDGEQFWWRVRYRDGAGATIETANEVRIPVGRTVTFLLESPDVIHSFWIPGLAGKLDMIPGRTNELVAIATSEGSYRGACAEFCGLSHANMAFDVLALSPSEFDEWLTAAAQPAAPLEHPGRSLFDAYGCAGCHAIRGHFESAGIGPDLTHFGSRRTLGAGTLPPTEPAIADFILDSARAKPGSLMPPFKSMPRDEALAIAAYLQELR